MEAINLNELKEKLEKIMNILEDSSDYKIKIELSDQSKDKVVNELLSVIDDIEDELNDIRDLLED